MPTSPSSLFRHSLLAAAILTATGCASTAPQSPGQGGFGESLANAGRATADVTRRAWHRTGYLLGLHDEDGGQKTHPMDEVDLAMLEEDAPLPVDFTKTAPADGGAVALAVADVESAIAKPAVSAGVEGELVAMNDSAASDGLTDDLAVGRFVTPADTLADAPQLEPVAKAVALDDYTHVVGESETLWDIAKMTTGDATNWHVLADVNNLAPNAAVYPGQGLMIPADMVKPEIAAAGQLPAVEAPVVADAAPSERLAVPTAPSATDASDGLDLTKIAAAPAQPSPVAPAVMSPTDDARGFRIESGETLWDFAKRTTGDATYWQAIAAHNGFDEQRAVSVRAGEEIFVPEALVRAELGGAEGAATQLAASETTAVEAPSAPRMVPIAEASDALPAEPAATAALASADALLDGTQDITIVEAAYRGDEGGAPAATATAGEVPGEITISGTYYPKAVYNDADFSSSLLMRVSPGTSLNVASVDGPWYAVETDDGIGYVHDRDIK